MKTKRKILLLLPVICMTFQFCKKSSSGELKGVALIWANDKYCAFTDLIRYHDTWYCIFREAESHIGSNGIIRIMTSKDSQNWTTHNILKVDNFDLRDPKFIVDFSGQLCIYSFSTNSTESRNLLWKINNSSGEWSGHYKIDAKKDWLWRISRYNQSMYSMGYFLTPYPKHSAISLYYSNDTIFPNFRKIVSDVSDNGCPTESSILFADSTYIITRRDCDNNHTWLGVSTLPPQKIIWNDLGITLQSPNMINTSDGIYVAGRAYSNEFNKVVLYKLNNFDKSLQKIGDIPSKIDSGYPGMYEFNDTLWISYYSVGLGSQRGIYLYSHPLK